MATGESRATRTSPTPNRLVEYQKSIATSTQIASTTANNIATCTTTTEALAGPEMYRIKAGGTELKPVVGYNAQCQRAGPEARATQNIKAVLPR